MSSLYDVFVEGQREDVTWHELWCRMVEHDEMDRAIKYAIHRFKRKYGLPIGVSGYDLFNDIVIHFGQQLRRDKSLRFDYAQLSKFDAWISRIAYNSCITVMRTELRRRGYGQPIPRVNAHYDTHEKLHARELANKLPHAHIVELLVDGLTRQEIADVTGLSYWQVWRRITDMKPAVERLCA